MGDATTRFTVTEDDTALAVGSGSLPVLGTPRLLAWCEAATCSAIGGELSDAETSVGTRVDLEHLAATAVGGMIEITARQVYADGRLRRYAVSAREVRAEGVAGKLVGSGEVTRVIVDADRFMARISRQ